MGIRYNKVSGAHQREIVLLKGYPCKYGKCSFCNYIEDNSLDEAEIEKINFETLDEVTGEFKILEVINSGSVFELPKSTMEKIKEVVEEKKIEVLYFEIYYGYIKRLDEIKKMFPGMEIRFRMGLETFDNDIRKNLYNKNFILNESQYAEIAKEVYSVCLLICTQGETKEVIAKDIELALKYFRGVTVNVFIDNGTVVKQDKELVKWFVENYKWLFGDRRAEILIDNKDLGVFEQ